MLVITIMIKIVDTLLKDELNKIYTRLTGKQAMPNKEYHITLLKIYIHDKNDLKRDYKKIIDGITKEYVINLDYDKSEKDQYDIYGPYDKYDNFYIRKMRINKNIRRSLASKKRSILNSIFKSKIKYIKIDKDDEIYGNEDGRVLCIVPNYYNYLDDKLFILHVSICRINKIKNIRRIKGDIYDKYLKDLNSQSMIDYKLYPSDKNEVIITYLDNDLE